MKIIGSAASKRKKLGESVQSGPGVNVNQPGVCNQINVLYLPALGEEQEEGGRRKANTSLSMHSL